METVEDIVIVGAGISGLATALGLHRYAINYYSFVKSTDLVGICHRYIRDKDFNMV